MAGENKDISDGIKAEVARVQCIKEVAKQEMDAWSRLSQDMTLVTAATFARSLAEKSGIARPKCLGADDQQVRCDSYVGYTPIGAIVAQRASKACAVKSENANAVAQFSSSCNGRFEEIRSAWISSIQALNPDQRAAYTEKLATDLGLKPVKLACYPQWFVGADCDNETANNINIGLIAAHLADKCTSGVRR